VADSDRALYFDACATSPTDPEVIVRIAEVQRSAWGNPSSLHGHGLKAAEWLERSRVQLASSLRAEANDLVFTSGATESIHLALLGRTVDRAPRRLVVSSVEHPATMAAAQRLAIQGWEVVEWPVDPQGQIDLGQLDSLLDAPTEMVSLIWGQSEIGSLQPVEVVGAECRRRGITFHVDATQVVSQGRPDWSTLPADLLSASSHKCGGPKGVGFLLTRSHQRESMVPWLGGGGQEQGLRSGTQPVALIAGLTLAISKLPAWTSLRTSPSTRHLRDELLASLLEDPRLRLSGSRDQRLPHHISLLASDDAGRALSGRALVREMAQQGVAISSGSACASGHDGGSAVLRAIGLNAEASKSGIRISLGPWNNPSELPLVRERLSRSLDRLQGR
jgi:cysteine desulfurase